MTKKIKQNTRVLAVLVGTVAAGAGMGTALSSAAGTNVSEEPDATYLTPVSGSQVVEGDVADPSGGPSWAVRRYTGQTGLDCYEVGQTSNGEFGEVHRGKFQASPSDQPTGTCGDLSSPTLSPDGAQLGIYRRFDGAKTAERSVLYGIARKDVERVVVSTPDGNRTLQVGPAGTFLAVYSGDYGFAEVSVSYVYRDGTSRALRALK